MNESLKWKFIIVLHVNVENFQANEENSYSTGGEQEEEL